jgi:hypothetical protein
MRAQSAKFLLALAIWLAIPCVANADEDVQHVAKQPAAASVRENAKKAGHATKEVAKTVAHRTKNAAKAVGHRTAQAAKAVAHEAKEGAHEVKQAVTGEKTN